MMVKVVSQIPDFLQRTKGQLRMNEPMSKHTSWRTGGIADYFYTPADREDLINLLKQLPEEMQVHWIGLGSNLLIRDGGVEGIVISTSKGLSRLEMMSSDRIYVESGVSCAKVARTTARNNLSGVEFLAGVPGSFGGALAMNAGAFGGETWEWVEQLECIDRSGNVVSVGRSEVRYGYRHVELPDDYWILGGILKLQQTKGEFDSKGEIRSLLGRRNKSQPVQSANAGSVFKNPDGDFAAKLIEEAGLKGCAIGGAGISDIHANFIINNGSANSADIENLIYYVQDRVRKKCGVDLQLEVCILGREK